MMGYHDGIKSPDGVLTREHTYDNRMLKLIVSRNEFYASGTI